MPAFTRKALIPHDFTDPDGNPARVYFKAKMSLADEAALQEKYTQMKISTKGSNGSSPDMELIVSIKRQKLELLKTNLKKWEGLWFQEDGKLTPCIPRNIDRLDGTENDYWIDEVVELIGQANKPKEDPPETEEEIDQLKKIQDGEEGNI